MTVALVRWVFIVMSSAVTPFLFFTISRNILKHDFSLSLFVKRPKDCEIICMSWFKSHDFGFFTFFIVIENSSIILGSPLFLLYLRQISLSFSMNLPRVLHLLGVLCYK